MMRNGLTSYVIVVMEKRINKKYDIIIGGVANDDVFKSVDMYHRGIWDKKRTLQELKYFKKNNQIAFIDQKALDEVEGYDAKN